MARGGRTTLQFTVDPSLPAEHTAGHWFDDLAREIAGGKLSRRQALVRTVQGILAAGYAMLFPNFEALIPGRQKQAHPVPIPSQCTLQFRGSGGTVHLTTNAVAQGLSVEFTQTTSITAAAKETRLPTPMPGRGMAAITKSPVPTIARRTTITSDNKTLLEIDSQAVGGRLAQVTVIYGSVFSGVREATFTSSGSSVTGVIDGRRIVPLSVPSGTAPGHFVVNSFKFEDGRPGPMLRVGADVQQVLEQVFRKAYAQAQKCSKIASAQPMRQSVGGPVDPPDPCNDCQSSCASVLEDCSGGVAIACIAALFGYGACAAAGLAACDGAFLVCNAKCYIPGNGCCQQYCGGACCDSSDTCINDSFCCPAGRTVCNGVCCSDGEICNSGICCPQGQVVCNNVCCRPGTVCTKGICCPAGQNVCSGICCAPGQTCSTEGICCTPLFRGPNPPVSCNGVCCQGQTDTCCGKTCCPVGEGASCVNGQCRYGPCDGLDCGAFGNCCHTPSGPKCCNGPCCGPTCCNQGDVCLKDGYGNIVGCCPSGQVCGYSCCPSGQKCIDPHEETCAACPSGEVATICGTSSGTPGPTICCPPGVPCCNGQCCPFASDGRGKVVCCTPPEGDSPPFANGSFGCHHQAACIA